jgi:hypothetical protein
MTEPTEGDIVTAEDVAALNRATVARAAAFARLAGTALVVVGVVVLAAWAWVTVRQQQRLSSVEGAYTGLSDVRPGSDVSVQERIDVLSTGVVLVFEAALLVGVGLGLRLFADNSVARAGGTLTGYEVGDVMGAEEPDDEDDET